MSQSTVFIKWFLKKGPKFFQTHVSIIVCLQNEYPKFLVICRITLLIKNGKANLGKNGIKSKKFSSLN